jgi:hypothetical protein
MENLSHAAINLAQATGALTVAAQAMAEAASAFSSVTTALAPKLPGESKRIKLVVPNSSPSLHDSPFQQPRTKPNDDLTGQTVNTTRGGEASTSTFGRSQLEQTLNYNISKGNVERYMPVTLVSHGEGGPLNKGIFHLHSTLTSQR